MTPPLRGLPRELSGTLRRVSSWRAGSFALRTAQRYVSIHGTERALVLAGQAFSALIPLVIVVSTFFSPAGGLDVADSLTARFRLTGSAAESLRALFTRPPGAAQTITFGSALLLALSGLSLARTLQRTFCAAWQLPARGARDAARGAAALVLLLTQILLLSLLAGFLRTVPAGTALTLVTRTAASSALWLALQYLLLGGRVPWRRLLPGAVVAGAGQQGVAALSTLWVPNVIQHNAVRYGTIGVTFALLSWLVLMSVVLVVAAALSVELGGAPPDQPRRPPRPDPPARPSTRDAAAVPHLPAP